MKREVILQKHGCGAGWACCCCSTLLTWAIGVPVLLKQVFPGPWGAAPGNDLRLKITGGILTGFSNNDWSGVDGPYTDDGRFSQSALIIGNAGGVKWSKTRGDFTLDKVVPVASQSKIIAALAIYRLMQSSNNILKIDSKPSEFISSWPTTGNAGAVELRHLLSFTTGFAPRPFRPPGCSRDPSAKDNNWAACIDEEAGYKIDYTPGTTFQYGPWHLFIAAGMAMKATGKSLDKAAWTRVVKEELGFEPTYGTSTWKNEDMPDFAGGIEMSANQWQKLIAKLMFGNLLNNVYFDEFMKDHTWAVTKSANEEEAMYARTYLIGGWHYSQGHFRACDALCTEDEKKKYVDGTRYTWEEANEKCGFASGVENQTGPQPNVHHAVGAFGSYVWMDLTNQYYGVYIQYRHPLKVFQKGIITMIVVNVVMMCCACGGGCFICHKKAKTTPLPQES